MFLSEEEALQVIREELAPRGVDLSEKGTQPRDLDGADPKHAVAVEFVSASDYALDHDDEGNPRSWWRPEVRSSVQCYDLKGVAQSPPGWMKRRARGMRLGVFYDPMTRFTQQRSPTGDQSWEELQKARDEARRQAQAASRELLRQQVKDFVDWLKAQGVI
jgi:hypothetical protein